MENWCVTQPHILPVTFKWMIKRFSCQVREVGHFLQSSTFSSGADDNITWYMRAYPKGSSKQHENKLSIFLYPSFKEGKLPERIRFRVSVLDNNNEKSTHTFKTGPLKCETLKLGFGWPNFMDIAILRNKSDELLPNDILTIECEINLIRDSFNTAGKKRFASIPDCRLGNDLADLYHKESFSDVTLTAGGEEFRVHKNILAARSTVFAAMFRSEMREKNQDVIEIVDMDENVLRDLLCFLFSGKAPISANVKRTADLLSVADKYDLERLKVMCENDLCQQITTDNVSHLLLLAYLHNANELKATAMEFVYNPSHVSAVLTSENWSSVLNHPRLLAEMVQFRVQWELKNTVL